MNFELEFEVRTGASDADAAVEDAKPSEPETHEVIKAPLKPRAARTKAEKAPPKKADGENPDTAKPSADVVSLDAFRKK